MVMIATDPRIPLVDSHGFHQIPSPQESANPQLSIGIPRCLKLWQPHSKRRSSAARSLAGATDANIPSAASSPQHIDPLIQAPIWTYTTAAPKLQTHIRKWGGFTPSALTPDAGDDEAATNSKGRVPHTGNGSPGPHETERRVFDSPPASHLFC